MPENATVKARKTSSQSSSQSSPCQDRSISFVSSLSTFLSPFLSKIHPSSKMFWNTTETETSGPQTSERPNWLKNDVEEQSGKDWDTADKSVTSNPTVDLSPTSTNLSTTEKQTGEKGSWCQRLTLVGISVLFLAAFIYASINEKKEGNNIEWYLYYAFSAAIPVFFLCHYIMCFPVKIIYSLSVGMVCWSIVYIVIIALKLPDYPKGGNENIQTLREQYIWELSGVSAGLFSALFHACASTCFVTSKPKIEE